MELLSDIREKLTKCLTLQLPLESVSDSLVFELDEVCKAYPGKHALKLMINDRANKYSVNFFSLKYKVDVNLEMVNQLKQIDNLDIKLN